MLYWPLSLSDPRLYSRATHDERRNTRGLKEMNEDRKPQRGPGRITTIPRALLASLVAVPCIAAGIAWPAPAAASQALAQKYACVACHQATAKVVGPSWKD